MTTKRKTGLLSLRVSLPGLLVSCGITASVLTLLGFLGRFWWLFDLCSHFRVHYLLTLAIVIPVSLLLRQYKTVVFFIIPAALNIILMAPFYMSRPANAADSSYNIRAMLINVDTFNEDYSLIAQTIKDDDPDIFILLEVNHELLSNLTFLQKTHPFSTGYNARDYMGISLYSRFKLKDSKIMTFGKEEAPSVFAEIETKAGNLSILGVHPIAPWDKHYSHQRNNHFKAISNFINTITGPVLLLGDFNATPWSYHFQHMLKKSGLKNSSYGYGIQPTWPADKLIFFIPIDHCLHSQGISILDRRTGPPVGSDHLPVIVDFFLTPTDANNTADMHTESLTG